MGMVGTLCCALFTSRTRTEYTTGLVFGVYLLYRVGVRNRLIPVLLLRRSTYL